MYANYEGPKRTTALGKFQHHSPLTETLYVTTSVAVPSINITSRPTVAGETQ